MPDPDPHVASPCVRKCCLDDDDVCLGCGRSIQEIMGWNMAASAERRDIVAKAAQRLTRLRGERDRSR